jgi:hypothetical protein
VIGGDVGGPVATVRAASLVAGVLLLIAAGILLVSTMIVVIPIHDVGMSHDTWLGAGLFLVAGLIMSALADALIIAGLRPSRSSQGWKVTCPICCELIRVRWKITLGFRIAKHLSTKHDYAMPMATMDEDRHYATIRKVEEIARHAERD